MSGASHHDIGNSHSHYGQATTGNSGGPRRIADCSEYKSAESKTRNRYDSPCNVFVRCLCLGLFRVTSAFFVLTHNLIMGYYSSDREPSNAQT
jgi:hypothetical protein